MNLIWVSHSERLAGAEMALAEGVSALTARGHRVTVAIPRPGPLGAVLGQGTDVTTIPYNPWASSGGQPSIATRLRWLAHNLSAGARDVSLLARRENADAILSNTLTAPVGAFAAQRTGLPHVWFAHEFGSAQHRLSFHLGRPLSLRLVGWLSTRVLAGSETLAAELRGLVAPTPVDLAYYSVVLQCDRADGLELAESSDAVVCVGMLTPGKGQADVVSALGLLRQRNVRLRLVLVGDGLDTYVSHLRTLARRLRVDDQLTLLPGTTRAYRAFRGALVAVNCSRAEGLGRVTVEAMKMGVPVIGAADGATPELLANDRGWLYPAGCPETLAQRVLEILGNREESLRRARAAQTWAHTTFNEAAYGEALERSLLAAVHETRKGASPRSAGREEHGA